MTKRSEHEWLGDIIAWGERLQRHIAGVDRAGFLGSEVIQDAVCKCVEAVGEAAGKLDDLDPELDRTAPGAEPQARPEDARSHDPRVLQNRLGDRLGHGYHVGAPDRGSRPLAHAEI